jgi:hypothetical protein
VARGVPERAQTRESTLLSEVRKNSVSNLDEAIIRLERAVARLEIADNDGGRVRREPEQPGLREFADAIAARIDNALARIDLALGGEG